MQFIKIQIKERDRWNGKSISQLHLPTGVIVAMIKRNNEMIIPRGNTVLQKGDGVILGAEPFLEREHEHISLKEVVIKKHNPWNGQKIRDLDISRQAVIVLIKRNGRAKIPHGDLVLMEGDNVFLYTHRRLSNASEIEIG